MSGFPNTFFRYCIFSFFSISVASFTLLRTVKHRSKYNFEPNRLHIKCRIPHIVHNIQQCSLGLIFRGNRNKGRRRNNFIQKETQTLIWLNREKIQFDYLFRFRKSTQCREMSSWLLSQMGYHSAKKVVCAAKSIVNVQLKRI